MARAGRRVAGKMDQVPTPAPIVEIAPAAAVDTVTHGWRAKCLQRLIRMQLPVPRSFAIPAATVRAIAGGGCPAPTSCGG